MTDKIKCEIAHVHVKFNDGKEANLILPAHTRTEQDFNTTIEKLRSDYIKNSNDIELSVADFAFWLMTFAATEPFTQ